MPQETSEIHSGKKSGRRKILEDARLLQFLRDCGSKKKKERQEGNFEFKAVFMRHILRNCKDDKSQTGDRSL